ncbi:MAG: class IV adenylate cyclase [Desulfobacterales bacterium]
MSSLEIEVKFFIPDTDTARNQIKALTPEFLGATDETNIRYETEDCGLLRKKSLLRLRRTDRATLTFKSESPDPSDEYKIHREYEVIVDNFEAMQNILVSLGFHPEQVYEKKRESYKLGDVVLCLDTMPYGNFLEIEGPGPEIRPLAKRLGLKWQNRILLNYLEMFEQIKTELGLSFSDVTFKNFQTVEADPADLIPRFEVGADASANS